MNEISNLRIPAQYQGLRVVDSDTHISEWDDLWTSRATPKYKDRVPQKKMYKGKLTWMIDGDKSLGLTCPVSAVRPDHSKSTGFEFLNWTWDDVHKASYDVKARLK